MAESVYEQVQAEIDSFYAKLAEKYGVRDMLVMWASYDGSAEDSGWHQRGNDFVIYGMAKRLAIRKEAFWRKNAKAENT